MDKLLLTPLARIRLGHAISSDSGVDYLARARGFLDNSDGTAVSDASALDELEKRGLGVSVLTIPIPGEEQFVKFCERAEALSAVPVVRRMAGGGFFATGRYVALPLWLFVLIEAALLMAAALQPYRAAVYVLIGAVVLYWFAVRFGNPSKPS